MKALVHQLAILTLTVLAFIQCASGRGQYDLNRTSNDDADDEVAALQVHVSASRASTTAKVEKALVPIHVTGYIQESQVRSNVVVDWLQNSSNGDAINRSEGSPMIRGKKGETKVEPRIQQQQHQQELTLSELANSPSARILGVNASFVFSVLALAVGGILAILIRSPSEIRSKALDVGKPDLRWYHYVLLAAISWLGPGDMDAVNPACPDMAAGLQTSDSSISTLLTLSMFVRGVSKLTIGSLSDNFGQKKMLLVSMTTTLSGLLICMNASSIQMLYLGYFVKGLGEATDAIIQAVVRMLVEDPAKRMHALSLIVGLQPVVSTMLNLMGTDLTRRFGWRSVYLFLYLWAAALMMGYTWLVPETRDTSAKKPVLEQFALTLCNSRQWFLLVPFVSIFGLTTSVVVNLSFVLEDFGFSTTNIGLLIASLPSCICLGAAFTHFGLSSKDRSLFVTLRLAMGVVCLLLIATLSIGITFANSQWAIMASFWSVTFANGMCVPTFMAVYLEPLKDACGLASGILLGAMSIGSSLLGLMSVVELGAHGIGSMLLVMMLIHLVGQAVFWVGFGINREK